MKDVMLTAIAPILWGTTYVVTTEFLPGFHPFLAATLRALPVGIVLTALGRSLPKGIWWLRIFVLGTLNIGVFFALLFIAAYRLPGGVVTTIGALQPIIVLVLSWPLFGERPSAWALAASATGVVGVALLVLGPGSSWDGLGILASVGAAVSMALGVLLTKRWGRPAPLLSFTGWQLTAGALVVGVIALSIVPTIPPLDGRSVIGLAWLVLLNTGLAYVFWFRGIERIPRAWHLSVLVLLSPIAAVAAGAIVLDQTFSPIQLAGMLVVFASVIGAQLLSSGTKLQSKVGSDQVEEAIVATTDVGDVALGEDFDI